MMDQLFGNLAFDPLLPVPWIVGLGISIFIASIAAGAGRLRSQFTRLTAGLFLMIGLLNPQSIEEDREPLRDTVIVIEDRSDSMKFGGRDEALTEMVADLKSEFRSDGNLDIITISVPQDNEGTLLASALTDALAGAPSQRLAGVVALTDGRAHDITEAASGYLPENVPFHSLIIGKPEARDRRILATKAPKFGVVGEQAEYELLVEDPGFEGERARIELKLNGTVKARFPITIGRPLSIPLEIERRGSNTVELAVEGADGELTLNNNLFVSEIQGVRDRMRVLLITGEPHNGGRAWRNLLKSDPALDLVQFTILTSRSKYTNAGERELSLIQFPTRQLFEERLDEFDLIIFDQYERRSLSRRQGRSRPTIPPQYFQNIAHYVEDGGALLLATGPAFATQASLYRTPLVTVLPARPTGEILTGAFRPELNDKGRRHPITSDFQGNEDQAWGSWYRVIDNDPIGGDVLMNGPDGVPLFVIDKVRDGRVAMLMSDQAWLWAKGHDGGGPYREMFRRTAHWLMGEPELDAETLTGIRDGDDLVITRRSLDDVNEPVDVIAPNGTRSRVSLDRVADGLYRATLPLAGQGAYRLNNGTISSITAVGALNPKEYENLLPTEEILSPLATATNGLIKSVGLETSNIPEIRRPKTGRQTSGRDWMGLVAHEAYTVTQSRRTPLAPGIFLFGLFFLFLAWAWRREGQ
ncbi:MAG: hypothetical protein ABJO36_02575 [Litorimonas sp.]